MPLPCLRPRPTRSPTPLPPSPMRRPAPTWPSRPLPPRLPTRPATSPRRRPTTATWTPAGPAALWRTIPSGCAWTSASPPPSTASVCSGRSPAARPTRSRSLTTAMSGVTWPTSPTASPRRPAPSPLMRSRPAMSGCMSPRTSLTSGPACPFTRWKCTTTPGSLSLTRPRPSWRTPSSGTL